MPGKARAELSRSVVSKCEGGLACYVSRKLLCVEYISYHRVF
jgi:hypothetical protein